MLDKLLASNKKLSEENKQFIRDAAAKGITVITNNRRTGKPDLRSIGNIRKDYNEKFGSNKPDKPDKTVTKWQELKHLVPYEVNEENLMEKHGQDYLHFWWDHYTVSEGITDNISYFQQQYNEFTKQALDNAYDNIRDKTKKMFKQDVGAKDVEIFKSAAELLNTYFDNSEDIVRDIFKNASKPENLLTSGASISGYENRSYASLTKGRLEGSTANDKTRQDKIDFLTNNYTGVIDGILSDIESALVRLEKYISSRRQDFVNFISIDTIKKSITGTDAPITRASNLFSELTNEAVSNLRKVTEKDFKGVLKSFGADDLKKYDDEFKTAIEEYVKLSSFIRRLLNVKTTNNVMDLASIIGDVGNSFTRIGGMIGEVSVLEGADFSGRVLQSKLNKELHGAIAHASVTGSSRTTETKLVIDENFNDPQKDTRTVQKKNDVTIDIQRNTEKGEASVIATFGISVKVTQHQDAGGLFTDAIQMHSNANFSTLLKKARGMGDLTWFSDRRIFNIAAAHAHDSKPGQEKSLENLWISAKQAVVSRNIVDLIFGQGGYSDNAYFFAVNGKIIPMYYIFAAMVKQLKSHGSPFSTTLSRENMEKENSPNNGEISYEVGKTRSKRVMELLRAKSLSLSLTANVLNQAFSYGK